MSFEWEETLQAFEILFVELEYVSLLQKRSFLSKKKIMEENGFGLSQHMFTQMQDSIGKLSWKYFLFLERIIVMKKTKTLTFIIIRFIKLKKYFEIQGTETTFLHNQPFVLNTHSQIKMGTSLFLNILYPFWICFFSSIWILERKWWENKFAL